MAKERKLTLTILGNAKGALGAMSSVGSAGERFRIEVRWVRQEGGSCVHGCRCWISGHGQEVR
jgi:hypothetical protein